MFGDVIVPLDGSDLSARSLGPGAALADALDTTLRVVSYTTAWNHDAIIASVTRQCEEIDPSSLSVTIEPAEPGIVERLSDLVIERPSSLVVMSTIGRGATGALLGSVAEGLLQRVYGPALLIGPECDAAAFRIGGRVVVTLDGSDHSESILPVAEAWAIALGYDLDILEVLDPHQASAPAGGVDSAYVHNRAAEAEATIGRPVTFDVVHHDHPAKGVLRYADDNGAAMIAMATHGTTGLRRLIMGSTSMHVVHRAPCPVLVVRPPVLR